MRKALLALALLSMIPIGVLGQAGYNTIPTVTRSATFSSANAAPLLLVCSNGQSNISVQVTGTFSLTLQPKVANDGNNYANMPNASTITGAGPVTYALGGFQYFELILSTYSSGTAYVTASCSASTGGASNGSTITVAPLPLPVTCATPFSSSCPTPAPAPTDANGNVKTAIESPLPLPVAPQGTAAPTIPPATPSPAPPQNAVPSLAYQHALSSSGYTQLIYGDQLYNGNPSSSGWSETIPASASKITLITSLSLSSAGTVTAYVGYSASSSCTSPTTQGGPYYLSTAAGFVKPQSLIPYWKIPGGDYGCIDLSASVSVGVDENFAQM